MRPSAPDHKIVYVRFHKRIDEKITEFSEKTGMRRATAVTWIRNRYMQELLKNGVQPESVTEKDLGFTGIEESYFISLGRGSEGSMLGKGMQLTVDKREERTFSFIAMQCGLSSRDFLTAILVQYFDSLGML